VTVRLEADEPAAGYERLVELARRERALLEAGDLDGLEEVARERDETVALLPAQAPAAVRELLLELRRTLAESERLLTARRAHVAAELAATRQGRALARSYGSGSRPRRLDATV